MSEHMGEQIKVAGFAGLDGLKRHSKDTETQIILTLYDQEGRLQELPVERSRDMEIFQEWLRRFDRYTTKTGRNL